MVLVAAKLRINVPPPVIVGLLFLIPAGALTVCEWVAWTRTVTIGSRIGWMLFTLLAMAVQVAAILVVLRVILVTAIGYAQ